MSLAICFSARFDGLDSSTSGRMKCRSSVAEITRNRNENAAPHQDGVLGTERAAGTGTGELSPPEPIGGQRQRQP